MAQFLCPNRKCWSKVEIEVSGIDDNGFVALEINPEISVAVPTGDVSGGYSIQTFRLES